MDEQDRPVGDAAKDTTSGTVDRGLLVVGLLFAVIGVVQLVGPGDGGVALLGIGFVFLASAGVRLRR